MYVSWQHGNTDKGTALSENLFSLPLCGLPSPAPRGYASVGADLVGCEELGFEKSCRIPAKPRTITKVSILAVLGCLDFSKNRCK